MGNQTIVYANPDEPENYIRIDLDATGSYRSVEHDTTDNAHITSLNTGRTSSYTAGGETNHIDGHKDSSCESTCRENVTGDKGVACKTNYQTATEGSVIAHNRFKKEFVVAASDSKSFSGSFGDQVNEHSGNWHEAFEKDHVQAVSGNKLTMIEKGDYAAHVQKGNWDTHVEGKGRFYSGKDILIESGTKIVLKVGGSTIEITSSKITINADRIDLNP